MDERYDVVVSLSSTREMEPRPTSGIPSPKESAMS